MFGWNGKQVSARDNDGALAVRREAHRFQMFGCVHERIASDREIFFDLDRHSSGLAGFQIVTPDVTGLLEHDCLLGDRRKLDVEILKGGELSRFLGAEIGRKEIHAAVAIRQEINLVVRSPHWADVLRRIVGQVFGGAGFEIVDPNVVGHAAAIMLPGPELAKDAVERHFRIVGRERRESAARHRQLLRQFRVETHAKERADEIVERLHAGTKHDLRFRIFPRHHDVVRAHPVGDIVPAEGR